MIKIQGNQIKPLEDLLSNRYKVPIQYIKSVDKCPSKEENNFELKIIIN